jgi:hypothetical protein
MDISSEMIHSLLPLLMVKTLGASRLCGRPDRRTSRVNSPDRQGILGPLLAVGLLLLGANDFRAALWVAVIPGLTAVALLALDQDS